MWTLWISCVCPTRHRLFRALTMRTVPCGAMGGKLEVELPGPAVTGSW